MMRDFGSGLTFDDLIGLTALEISRLILPNDDLGMAIQKASQLLLVNQLGKYLLMELWGDGHSVWQTGKGGNVAIVSPTGQLTIDRE